MGRNKKKGSAARWIAVISTWTFFLAVALGFMAQFLVEALYSLFLSFLILLAVIWLGIIFDLIGTAAAAADIAPLNAKAARRVPGARRGVYLVQHAEQAASFCNDVVGDISGIVSGALAAMLVIRIAAAWGDSRGEFYTGILLTALVAAMTVGGKAWGKNVAINRSTEVMLLVGRLLDRLATPLAWVAARRNR